ncbi:glycosyltransferase family 2 protein [Pseudomonas sp. TH03]|nr:glycosyltransferase family 2 protein [Pseudomonas sp. TH03]
MARTISQEKVAVLVCTYNGARYLKEQFDSFVNQTHKNWSIYVSDDGSSDATLDILKSYQQQLGDDRLFIFQGPRKGFAKNFLSLVKNASITANYYAFSDQDDIWFEEKLSRSIEQIEDSSKRPALYCSRTKLVDSNLEPMGYSPLFKSPPCFENALVQSIAGANTMLINNPARELMQRIPDDAPVAAHDWLAYLLVSGCGGKVIYDPSPTLHYRQHEGNLIGANADLRNQILRIRKMLTGRFSEWSAQNLTILHSVIKDLTAKNRQALEMFELARQSRLLPRLKLMKKSGVHRQTLKGNISLIAATLLNKI